MRKKNVLLSLGHKKHMRMARLVNLLFLFLFSFNCFSQTDQDISSTAVRETEPYIAINPADSNNLIAAWMTVSFPLKIATRASFDGGITWSSVSYLPHFSPSLTTTSADVSIAFNHAGMAFICYVDYKLSLDSGYVRVAKSINGGLSWLPPVNAVNALDQPDLPVDRPWIVCDQNVGSPYAGRIYVESKSYFGVSPPHKIWLSISSDTGATFSPIARLDNPVTVGTLTNIMAVPTIGTDGTFYCTYASWDTSFDPFPRFVCGKSTDGGTTFVQTTIAHPVTGSSISDSLYQGSYSLAANPANVNNLIFQATDARNGDPDILTLYSNNKGLTWSTTPLRVNDDAISNGFGQDMSWGAFAPNGTYGLAWRDRRNGVTNDTSNFEVYAAVSTDGGASFSANYCLSSMQSPFINMVRGNDFIGVAMTNSTVFTDWSDYRNEATKKEDIYVRKENLSLFTAINSVPIQTKAFKLYPNPANDVFYISLNDLENKGNLVLQNALGQTVLDQELTTQLNTIGIGGLEKGIYLFTVRINHKTYSGKIIKN
jgi:hypothetical protein